MALNQAREHGGGRYAAAEREHHRTNLWAQVARFIGLFLSPLIGLFAAWLIHLWAAGWHIHKGPLNWDVNTPRGMPTVIAICMALITVWVARKAGQFAEHRHENVRNALVVSVYIVGLMFSVGVGVGPSYVWTGLFFIATWVVAVLWSIARLDVTRNDKRSDEGRGDSFLEKVGLKDWRHRKVTPVADDKGRPLATEIEFEHAPGDTVDQLADAVPAFESVSGSVAGLSYANGGGRADQSKITVMHRDPLDEWIEIPPLPHEGGSITEPLLVGKYANGEWVWAYLAGDPDGKFSPTSYLHMGMNRTGKTQSAESVSLTDAISRRDVVILYLNKAKGVQDARCIIPGIEAAVIADEESATGLYREAIIQIKRIMGYRQRQLGLFGIHEWNAEQCWNNPPWRTTDEGERVQMERMPFLICHFAEADAILQEAPGDATYIVSKGLSLGICNGFSLQRADATKMPTGLRFNLGTAWCFGCGDSDSASMALSDWVVKAGAHPEKWGQRKPGYFYFEGLGIQEELFVVPARGFGVGPDGTKLRDELLKRNLRNAPRMAKLDRGSAAATGVPGEPSWWDATAKSTDELRSQLLKGSPANQAPPAKRVAVDEEEELRNEVEREICETTEIDGFELFPQDPDSGERATFADAFREPVRLDPADDISWEDPKPELGPRDRAKALQEFARTVDTLMERKDLADPADPSGNTVIVTAGMIADEFRYRSRPFFSSALNGMSQGTIGRDECPTDKIITAAPDLGLTAGKYRIQRPRSGNAG
jgi:hypothetical protein